MTKLLFGRHPTRSILQTFLDISPISSISDIGDKIIERKRKRINKGRVKKDEKT